MISACIIAVESFGQPRGVSSDDRRGRQRPWTRAPSRSASRSILPYSLGVPSLSSNPDDSDATDESDKSAPAKKRLEPLFPDLAPPEIPSVSKIQSSSYDDAADALLRGRRKGGERALSSSDQVRDALESGGVMEALAAIANAREKGGDWYQGDESNAGREDTVEDTIGDVENTNSDSDTSINPGTDSLSGETGADDAASDLASIDYLLDRIKNKSGRSPGYGTGSIDDVGDVDSLWSD